MAIPQNIFKDDILMTMKYIDENGVPDKNKSSKYYLVDKSGKRYPPKYVIAVANHLVNKEEISTDSFNAIEAKNFLEGLNFDIEIKQEKYKLTITANQVVSTDDQFTMDNLGLGDNYKPLDTNFKNASGIEVRRKYNKGERRNSNQTLPRLACQIYEQFLSALSAEEKESFPICQYTPTSEIIRGIFSSVEEFKTYRNSIEYLIYTYDEGSQFVFYCWNIFSTIIFIQECLKRFGQDGDQFVLIYREKIKQEIDQLENDNSITEEQIQASVSYRNPYSKTLIISKNIILRGAPGTGKTYLAKEIVTDIISNGNLDDFSMLTDEQKQQVEFVQFHPSYDYSDFVEGLRPKTNDDGTVGFELQDGVFKQFLARAKKNLHDSRKSSEEIEKETSAQEIMYDYFSNIEMGVEELETVRGTKFYITSIDSKYILYLSSEKWSKNYFKNGPLFFTI